jgi:hypothetical protein
MISSCSPWIVATMSLRRPHHRARLAHGHAEAGQRVAEQFVLDPQQGAASGGEVAAAGQTHGLATGGPVERLGHRGPPVDDHRLLLGVAHRDAADVEVLGQAVGRLRGPVDPAEAQGGISQFELGEPVDDRVVDDLALEAGLLGATPADLDHRGEPRRHLARPLEARVRVVDVGLLGFEIGMWGHGLPRVDRRRPPDSAGASEGAGGDRSL